MIFPGKAFADTVFHKTGEGWQDVNGRIDALLMQGTIQYDLPLCNVAGQVRDGMGNIIAGHGKNRDLGDRTAASGNDPGALIKGGQLAVKITGIAFTAWDLPFG